MRTVERLYRLQELDSGLALYERKRQDWLSKCQRLEKAVADLRHLQKQGEASVREQERAVRQAEGALLELETHRQALEQRLYGGTVRSEKEAAAVQGELEQLRRHKEELEDQALQRMMELDERRALLDKLGQQEAQLAREQESVVQEATAQEELLRKQVEPLRTAREQLAAEVPPAVLQLYDQIRRIRGGPALAPVVENSCGNCRLELAVLTRKAAAGETVARCENCGCILYVPEK